MNFLTLDQAVHIITTGLSSELSERQPNYKFGFPLAHTGMP